jgi:hypothetical protein
MAITQTCRAPRMHAADGPASTASDTGTGSRRAWARLWVLLHAQALLNGTAGTAGGVALIEDDRRRMAGAGRD